MALQHSWDFSVDPGSAPCIVHGGHLWTEESASAEYGVSPDRITAEALGGVNWSRQEVRVGDNNVAGSGAGERASIYTGVTAGVFGNIRSYRFVKLLRPAVDYDPTDSTFWNVLLEFHRAPGTAWPGGTVVTAYAGEVDAAMSPHIAAVGDLFLQLYGGHVPTAGLTGSTINEEDWRFLAVGAWEGKALDIALRVKWAHNSFDAGARYFQAWNGGQPTNYASSGWIELQYRLGTVTSSIAWGAWTWFDPAGWTNGPDSRRHYRPTLFYFDDTATSDSVFWKLQNYRLGPGDGTSVVRYAVPKIGETHTDVGAPEVSGAPATADPTEGPFGTTAVIDDFTGGDLDPLPAPWTDNFSGGAHPSWKRASNAAAPST